MSVLIKNMEIPEHCGYCRFRYDGICHALQKTQYSEKECPLVSVNDIKTAQQSRLESAIHGKSPEEIYEFIVWLFFRYAKQFTDSRLAIIDWLKGESDEH